MKDSILKEELLKVYNIYVEGFKSNNISLIESVIHFPITILKDGKTLILNYFPINPKELKKKKNWNHSTDWNFDITAINATHAHIIASAIRRRVDDLIIEKVNGFYGFVKINKDWKMYVFSELIS